MQERILCLDKADVVYVHFGSCEMQALLILSL